MGRDYSSYQSSFASGTAAFRSGFSALIRIGLINSWLKWCPDKCPPRTKAPGRCLTDTPPPVDWLFHTFVHSTAISLSQTVVTRQEYKMSLLL